MRNYILAEKAKKLRAAKEARALKRDANKMLKVVVKPRRRKCKSKAVVITLNVEMAKEVQMSFPLRTTVPEGKHPMHRDDPHDSRQKMSGHLTGRDDGK
jgi:hypothetical protein